MRTAALLCALAVATAAASGAARGFPIRGSGDGPLAATVLREARSVRARGCEGRAGLAAPMRLRRRLTNAARRLASGADLGAATRAAGYRARLLADIRLSGDLTPSSLEHMLRSDFCSRLTDPALTDIGVYARAREAWVLAAAPLEAAALFHPAIVARRVLALVNAARSAGRRCGARRFGPAPPLAASGTLERAALAHSRDMAEHDYFSHVGRGGSTPGDRVARAGFRWSAVGENIAWGQTSARAVVEAWLASPGHCANIMDPVFTATAVAYSVDSRSPGGIYWTEEFATPLSAARRR